MTTLCHAEQSEESHLRRCFATLSMTNSGGPAVDILIDNQPYQASCSAQKTIRELAQEFCSGGSRASQRVVIDVRCNGEAVPDERLEAVLEMPADDFERLEFQTRPIGA